MVARRAEPVTFLLTDIEGSTRVLARAGYRYPLLVAEHREIIDAAAADHGGAVVSTQGDSCLATFPTAGAALRAAVDAQRRLESHVWDFDDGVRVRIGIHSGQAVQRDGEYFGMDLHLAARIADAGHGGQVLVSEATQQLVAAEALNGLRLRDLGLHRLKGLAAPVRLYQVESPGLPHAFPALRARRGEAHNLPTAQTSPLIGRAGALAEITDLLVHRRLVTLTGPGGVGKTRLALHAGMTAIDAYPDGVWLIELGGVRDARSVPALIGVPFGVEVSDGSAPGALLVEALRDKAALLIMDNFEHLLDASPIVSAIVEACSGVRVLATSRERLNLAGEQVYPVSPLSLHSDAGPASDAVVLFIERARLHDPAFAPAPEDLRDIASICALTDGLPLAIELAAAQTRLLPVSAVIERLRDGLDALSGGPRDRPERHRALRNTIAWSYQLLSADEQRLFARLSVFEGPRTLDAVRAICMEGLDLDPVAGIASLVDKSMVQRRIGSDGEVTLVLLELLAEFAREVLAGSADAGAVRRRHAAYFADLAERADNGMLGPHALQWERVLDNDLENLRAALAWAFAPGGDARLGVRIAAALHLFWYWGGPHDDGPHWVRLALDHDELLADATRGRLRVAAGFFEFADSDLPAARRHWENAVAAFRSAGDDARACTSLMLVAVTYVDEADEHDHARRLADEAVALARTVTEHSRPLIETLIGKGEVARLTGRTTAAGACYREALAIAQESGDDHVIAELQSNLAYIAVRDGNYVTALELTLAGLEDSWKLGKPIRLAWSLGEVAGPELGLGRPERAARLLGAADGALDRMGAWWQPLDQPEHDRTLAGLEQVLGRERLDALLDEGAQMSLDEAFDYALAHPEPQRSTRTA